MPLRNPAFKWPFLHMKIKKSNQKRGLLQYLECLKLSFVSGALVSHHALKPANGHKLTEIQEKKLLSSDC